MEINSLRWPTNFLQREHSRNKVEKAFHQEARSDQAAFQVPETDTSSVNFSAITPRDLRAIALENYQAGTIDQDTYMALAEELPMHAIDAQGQVIDLSQITDETGFDFQDYYRNQFEIAMSLGDSNRAGVLRGVIAFLGVDRR